MKNKHATMQKQKFDKNKSVFVLARKLLKYCNIAKIWYFAAFFLMTTSVACSIFATYVAAVALNDFIYNFQYLRFVLTMVIMSCLYLFYFILGYSISIILVIISQNIGYNIRKYLFQKIQKIPFSYLDSRSVGDTMSRITNDVDVVLLTVSQNISIFLNSILTTIGISLMLFLIAPVLAMIIVILISILFSLIAIFLKKSQPFFEQQQALLGTVNDHIEQYLSAHKIITLFNYHNQSSAAFLKINKNLAKSLYKAELIGNSIFPYNNFISNFSIVVVIIVALAFSIFDVDFYTVPGINLGSFNNISSISLIFVFILFMRQLTAPIANTMSIINLVQKALVGLERIVELSDVEEQKEYPNAKDLVISKCDIDVKNLNFGYVKDKLILENISFSAKHDTINAIVGPTGSGKTTLINLLARFYDIEENAIFIGQQDIAKVSLKSLRKNITMVLQDAFLFSVSIKENIRYGNLDASDEEIIAAAKMANVWDFIKHLPNGIDTVIDHSTVSISEGEKQLVAIARAFLSKAKIVILDEATSYVDTKNEKDIQDAIAKLTKGKVTFIIAHRLSTIKNADNIIVIKDGKIIEQGNHQQLLAKKGFYYDLNNVKINLDA